jgi:ferredoxin
VSPLKVDIDRTRCTGHGRCYGLAPDVFEPDDDGFSVAVDRLPDLVRHRTAGRAQLSREGRDRDRVRRR